MTAIAVDELHEFCANCGEWVSYLHFDHSVGWCSECTQDSDSRPRCRLCGVVLASAHRTTCHTCRQEAWFVLHSDELEYLMIVKGYSLSHARVVISKMVRPICHHCGKPISGAHNGALFCKSKKPCHTAYRRYNRLIKEQGLTPIEALAILKREA